MSDRYVTMKDVKRFDSFMNALPRCPEKNSGEYIIDDSDYLPLDKLLERTKRQAPSTYNAIKAGGLAQYDGLASGTADVVGDAYERAEAEAYAKMEAEQTQDVNVNGPVASTQSENGDAQPAVSGASDPVSDSPHVA